MEFNKVIKERYSVRNFKSDKISPEVLKNLLEIINDIPTATNAQPQKIYILESEESRNKINKLAKTYHAPVVLLICADTNIAWHSPFEPEYNSAEMDGSITATYLMLKAYELGLGSLFIRWFNPKEVHQEFNLPNHIKPICLLAIGYPSADSKPSSQHYIKKPLDTLIKYL